MLNRMNETFKNGGRIYCLGIGGIGLSAVAQWLNALGVVVSGTDMTDSDIVSMLREKGIAVDILENIKKIPDDTEILIYSDAVPYEHPAREFARKNGVREMSYAQCLGILTQNYRCIAVAGSHGKSTTTALIAHILIQAGMDPTVVIGTKIPTMGNSNFRLGKSDIVVVEADEYKNHFLELNPTVAVVTNVDYDHVDTFPTRDLYLEAFKKFVGKIKPSGSLILYAGDSATTELLSVRADLQKITFEFSRGEHVAARENTVEYFINKITNDSLEYAQKFSLTVAGRDYGEFSVSFPGDHFLLDTAAAIAAVSSFNIDSPTIQKAVASFKGTWRRFELIGKFNGVPVISDYAHHPTELRALLQGARQVYRDKKITIVFQPHHGARTAAFGKEFVEALSEADEIVVVDVYGVAGRENSITGTNVEKWVDELRSMGCNAEFAKDLNVAEKILADGKIGKDVILCVGAGSIDQLARKIGNYAD
jgi:UDP-N-acetylmuramate--alanine ligase